MALTLITQLFDRFPTAGPRVIPLATADSLFRRLTMTPGAIALLAPHSGLSFAHQSEPEEFSQVGPARVSRRSAPPNERRNEHAKCHNVSSPDHTESFACKGIAPDEVEERYRNKRPNPR